MTARYVTKIHQPIGSTKQLPNERLEFTDALCAKIAYHNKYLTAQLVREALEHGQPVWTSFYEYRLEA